jgi:putative Mg2+ transporter-C (MgtC) family protein
VAGIGFIGAGAIMRRGEGVIEGLTTAATIWVVAAIGLAAGAGLYLVSAVTTAVVTIVLLLPHPIR